MKTSTIVGAVVVAVVIVGGGYWYWHTYKGMSGIPTYSAGINGSPNQGNLGQPDNGTPQTPSNTNSSGDGTSISQNLILGIGSGSGDLTAYNGMTLYTYAADSGTPGSSACTGGCATAWPPYTVASKADINVSSATTGTVGTITRADGSLQVTYNGAPLYFYTGDTKPGDVNGNGVNNFYVAKP